MKFKYKAYNSKGKVVKGEVEASDRKEAIADLKLINLKVFAIEILKESFIKMLGKKFEVISVSIKEKIQGDKLLNKRLESFKEEIISMGHTEEEFKDAILGSDLSKFDVRKYKSQFDLTHIQIEKIMSGRINKVENMKKKELTKKEEGLFSRFELFKRVSTNDIITFTEQLSIMLSTDIELIEALETIQKELKNKKFKRIIDEIIYDLTKGKELSVALEQHPKVFNTLYVAMVKVGESTGSDLHKSLDDMVSFLKMNLKVKREFLQASIYPGFVLGVLLVLILFVNYFVMPRFKTIFEANNFELPFLTQLIFTLSENMEVLFIGGSIITLVLGIAFWNFKPFRAYVKTLTDTLVLKVPVIKGAFKAAYMYQLSLTISITLKNGISITDALNLVANIITNKHVNKDITDIYYSLEKGRDMSEAFSEKEHIETIVKMAVSAGEKSGKLNETLGRVSNYYETELDAKINTLVQFLVPVSILVVAVVAAPFIIGMYLPIMSLTEQLGNMR